MVNYTTAFETLGSDLEWNEPSQYKWGLQHHVKTQLIFLNPYPSILRELETVANKIRSLYTELDSSQPSKTLHTSSDKKGKGCDNPTPTSKAPDAKASLLNYVNAKECDARRNERLCVNCGALDHIMCQCKNRYSVTRLSTNKGGEPAKKKEEPKNKSGKVAVEGEPELEELGNK